MKRVLSILLAAVLLVSLVPAGAVEFSFTAAADTSGCYTYTVSEGCATITDVDTAISGAATELVIDQGDTVQGFVSDSLDLSVTFGPEGAREEEITWTSDDPSVVYISDWGAISLVGEGTATLTVTSESGLTDSITVTVVQPPALTLNTPVNGTMIGYDVPTYRFVPAKDGQYAFVLQKQAYGELAITDANFEYVNGYGDSGEVTVQAYLFAGEVYYIHMYQYNANAQIEFTLKVTDTVPATSMTINDGDTYANFPGSGHRFDVTFGPENAAREEVTWTSSDPDIADIYEDGYAEFYQSGTVVFTATSASGFTDRITVTVLTMAETAEPLTSNRVEIDVNKGITIFSFTPTESGKYAFTSSPIDGAVDPMLRLLDAEENELARADDELENRQFRLEYTLTAGETYYLFLRTYEVQDQADSYLLTVERAQTLTDITIVEGDITGDINDEYQLSVSFAPDGALPEGYVFTSANSLVAEVTDDGWLWLRGAGTTTVTVTSDSGLTDTITVTVNGVVEHVYDNACDADCNVCGAERVITHIYGEDDVCDVCGYNPNEQYYTYKVTNGKVTITDVSTAISGDVRLPATLGGYPVTSIGYEAFFGCNEITSLVISPNVTTIGNKAFYDCKKIASVTIPDSVTSIGQYAFAGCKALTNVVIPSSVSTIAIRAFRNCTGLVTITIPLSVTEIGNAAFSGCTALCDVIYGGNKREREAMTIGTDNAVLDSATWQYTCAHTETALQNTVQVNCTVDGYTGDTVCLGCDEMLEKGSVISSVGHIWGEDNICTGCGGDRNIELYTYTTENGVVTITDVDTAISGHVVIPATLDGCPVVAIANNAFRNCTNMTAITIPASVTSIGNYAFKDCTALETVYYNAENCTTAGVNAYPVFHGCTALTTAYIGKNVQAIPPRLFRAATALTTVYLTKNTMLIGANAFYLCESLATVNYVGAAFDFIAADIKSYNDAFLGAAWYYNMPCYDEHDWTGECDSLCDLCGEKRNTVHGDVVDDAAVEPTCTESGLTAGSHCAVCGNVIVKQTMVAALGHAWDNGTVLVAPTATTTGEKMYTCTTCGETKTVTTTLAEIIDGYYHYNGVVKGGVGLVQVEDAYYFITATGAVKTGRYTIGGSAELGIEKGTYYFFEDGKLNLETGVYEGRYYNDRGLSEAYAGLVVVNGAKYYIGSGGNVTTGRYFLTKLNGVLPRKFAYTFYEDGRMLEETRIYDVDGFYYENGHRIPYAGVVEYEGDYYYVADHGAYVKNKVQILVHVNNTGKQKNGRYYFNEEGKMQYNVIYNGRYYGADGLAPYNTGVVEVDGKLYYNNGTHGALRKSATFKITAAKANGLCAAGTYTADENGVLTPAA